MSNFPNGLYSDGNLRMKKSQPWSNLHVGLYSDGKLRIKIKTIAEQLSQRTLLGRKMAELKKSVRKTKKPAYNKVYKT